MKVEAESVNSGKSNARKSQNTTCDFNNCQVIVGKENTAYYDNKENASLVEKRTDTSACV